MKYCTDDGKRVFDTEQEVFDYEKKVKAEKEERAKLVEEKQARREEIKRAYEVLFDKINKYETDYGEPIKYRIEAPSAVKSLFDLFNQLYFW